MSEPTVLIIDDEPDIRESIGDALKYEPYELQFAENGKEGLERFHECSPLVVLLDLRMPLMDGLEVLQQLKLSPEDPYLVIVLTGHGDDDDVQQCYELGIHLFIRKPFNIFELQGAVKQGIALKQAQQSAMLSRSYLDNILSSMINSLIVINPDATIRTVNQATLNLLGYGENELIGQLISMVIEDERLFPGKGVKDLNQRDFIKGIEKNYLTKDGNIVPVFFSGSVMRDQRGKLQAVVCVAQDITERKQAEEKLQASEIKFRTMTEALPLGIFLTNIRGECVYTNPAWQKMTNLSYQESLGEGWKKTIHPDDFERVFLEWEHSVKNQGNYEGIIHYRHKDGRILWVTAKAVPLWNGQKMTGYLGVVEDITERKQLEKERREMEDQRYRSQKLESLGTLAGGIAHDFNNILGAILGFTALLQKKGPRDDKEKHYLEQIYASGERASKLVQQILIFSRKETINRSPTNLSLIITEALDMLRATIPANIEIRQEIEQDSGFVLANPTQLHQLIINLCTNATHAMEAEGGLVEINLKKSKQTLPSSKGQKWQCLKLTVKDTGCGISLEDQEKIFDPFFTTKEVGKGTGLGLSLVHSIVEDLRGDIGVVSKLGKGTLFSISFPLIEGENIEESKHSPVARQGTEHILIVEDEPMIAEGYQEFLQEQGYRVTLCDNGLTALTLFKESSFRFDLVITDQAMPGMTGKQLSRELLLMRPELPIILTTGYSDTFTAEEARKIGIRKYLMKPIGLETLPHLIEECFLF